MVASRRLPNAAWTADSPNHAANDGGFACFVLPLEGTASESALIALPPAHEPGVALLFALGVTLIPLRQGKLGRAKPGATVVAHTDPS